MDSIKLRANSLDVDLFLKEHLGNFGWSITNWNTNGGSWNSNGIWIFEFEVKFFYSFDPEKLANVKTLLLLKFS